jgi:hypothetical protein
VAVMTIAGSLIPSGMTLSCDARTASGLAKWSGDGAGREHERSARDHQERQHRAGPRGARPKDRSVSWLIGWFSCARGTTTSRRGALALGHAAQAAPVKSRGPQPADDRDSSLGRGVLSIESMYQLDFRRTDAACSAPGLLATFTPKSPGLAGNRLIIQLCRSPPSSGSARRAPT